VAGRVPAGRACARGAGRRGRRGEGAGAPLAAGSGVVGVGRRAPGPRGRRSTGRPHDVLPADGAARPAARPVDRRRGVTVARLTSTTTPESETIGAASPSLVRPRPTAPAPQPLAGVTCPLLTAAIRRAEERWVSDHADDDDPDGIPRV